MIYKIARYVYKCRIIYCTADRQSSFCRDMFENVSRKRSIYSETFSGQDIYIYILMQRILFIENVCMITHINSTWKFYNSICEQRRLDYNEYNN